MADNSTNPPAVLAAIWNVMKDVRAIGKNGQMNGKQRYSFRQYDDMADALGQAFREHGIFVQTETLSSEYTAVQVPHENGGITVWTTCRIGKRYLFTSLVDGSTVKAEAFGEGRDNSDKATSKAETMATKSALSEAFMLATRELDPDAERPEIHQGGNGQAKPNGQAKGNGPAKGNGRPNEAAQIGAVKNELMTLGKQFGKTLADIKTEFARQHDGKNFANATLDELKQFHGKLKALAEQTPEDAAQAVADIEAQATGAAA